MGLALVHDSGWPLPWRSPESARKSEPESPCVDRLKARINDVGPDASSTEPLVDLVTSGVAGGARASALPRKARHVSRQPAFKGRQLEVAPRQTMVGMMLPLDGRLFAMPTSTGPRSWCGLNLPVDGNLPCGAQSRSFNGRR